MPPFSRTLISKSKKWDAVHRRGVPRVLRAAGVPPPPDNDPYGWARLCQAVANFMGADGLSVGISRYEGDARMDPGDNGIYVIEGWRVADVSVNLFFTSFAKQARRSRKGGFTGCANVFSPIPVTA